MEILGLVFAGTATDRREAMSSFVSQVLGLERVAGSALDADLFGLPDGSQFGVAPAAFHSRNLKQLTLWPNTLLATSTHDSKRSEDVRARINVLSEIPSEWHRAIRLWRSLKYECVYLHAFETGSQLRAGLARWIGYYDALRPHSSLRGQTPNEAYDAIDLRLAA